LPKLKVMERREEIKILNKIRLITWGSNIMMASHDRGLVELAIKPLIKIQQQLQLVKLGMFNASRLIGREGCLGGFYSPCMEK
jgi:hypothetical protein